MNTLVLSRRCERESKLSNFVFANVENKIKWNRERINLFQVVSYTLYELLVCFFSTEDGIKDSRGFISVVPVRRFALPKLIVFCGGKCLSFFGGGGDEMDTLSCKEQLKLILRTTRRVIEFKVTYDLSV